MLIGEIPLKTVRLQTIRLHNLQTSTVIKASFLKPYAVLPNKVRRSYHEASHYVSGIFCQTKKPVKIQVRQKDAALCEFDCGPASTDWTTDTTTMTVLALRPILAYYEPVSVKALFFDGHGRCSINLVVDTIVTGKRIAKAKVIRRFKVENKVAITKGGYEKLSVTEVRASA